VFRHKAASEKQKREEGPDTHTAVCAAWTSIGREKNVKKNDVTVVLRTKLFVMFATWFAVEGGRSQ
jgi:hypothetical protein